MKLSQIKALLPTLNEVVFKLDSGDPVPPHFHVTEVGKVSRQFIDCGGTIRSAAAVNFQLWSADDEDHRLKPTKLLDIILLSEQKLGLTDEEVEVEYQGETIGRYTLAFDGSSFILQSTATACLASDQCGIPAEKQRRKLSELTIPVGSCKPNSGCCS